MLKQVYRFLSILIISNLLFIPAALSKTQKSPECGCHKKSVIHRIFGHKKPAEKKPKEEKKPVKDDGAYVTKYGVYLPDDAFDTYPQNK